MRASRGAEEETLHIALLHYAAPPVVGGVETVIGHQAQQLNRGYQYCKRLE